MRVRSLIGLLLIVAVSAAAQTARKIPGINAKDAFPNGCVDCHSKRAGQPAPLSTIVKDWAKIDAKKLARLQPFAPKGVVLKGKHPPITAIKDVPASCMKCHTAASKAAPAFAPQMHGIHLTGGDANPFIAKFQGECTHCHKLNATTGVWTMPNGTEK